MSEFMTAVLLTLKHEGGYVNNPADPGGATNMGIEQRDMPNVPIEQLTTAQAVAYYQTHFWNSYYNLILFQDVANKIFDMGVLFGKATVVKLIQRYVNLPQDGAFGPNTLQAVNSTGETFLSAIKEIMLHHASAVVMAKPQEEIFLQGWVNRINS